MRFVSVNAFSHVSATATFFPSPASGSVATLLRTDWAKIDDSNSIQFNESYSSVWVYLLHRRSCQASCGVLVFQFCYFSSHVVVAHLFENLVQVL